jgi:hypothetical protein
MPVIPAHGRLRQDREVSLGESLSKKKARCQWLTPVIPATQEAEVRRIEIQSQPGQIV